MGALTSKHKQFTFRVWEPQTFIEIDETEVSKYNLRSEHLKTKRSRILPINYWMADKKRFSKESSLFSNPSIHFKNLTYFILEYTLQESKNITYLISNIKGYKKILNKLVDITINNIKTFCAKQMTKTLITRLEIYDDLLTSHKKLPRSIISSFDHKIKHDNIILLTNPRTESPMFNSYLFKHRDKFSFISFSAFASNFIKQEIPLTTYTIDASFKGHYDLSNVTIVTSCFNTLSFPYNDNIISLTPLYINKTINIYSKEKQSGINFYLFLKSNKTFQPAFLSLNINQENINLCLGQNSFDQFILRKVSQRYLERLFLLYLIIKPKQINSLVLLANTTTTTKYDLSLLSQTITSI
uniref:NADH dehydrogenase subunit G n=1 Tax=Physarum polycephalum TaxID=5791 RepID=F2Y9T5_PHYPO|nr:NADH dehydrogenase subunit G [Physarum polycephalum]|eukprot:Phypoly_transcript_00332.p2 GENE.Phypoly_transcript_00332~~Phypoly_transcript_00332.p2  ORF type:complete len:355 (+),score=-13.13 Phypoly_transcript_00332:95-1159(+)